jgi:hypothetical protein
MATDKESKGNKMENNVFIQNAFSSLKRNMTDFEVDRNAIRKAEWKSYRIKYNHDLDKIEESLRDLDSGYIK